jgi:hypothetical protein
MFGHPLDNEILLYYSLNVAQFRATFKYKKMKKKKNKNDELDNFVSQTPKETMCSLDSLTFLQETDETVENTYTLPPLPLLGLAVCYEGEGVDIVLSEDNQIYLIFGIEDKGEFCSQLGISESLIPEEECSLFDICSPEMFFTDNPLNFDWIPNMEE